MRVQGPDQTRAQWPCQSMPVLFTAVHSGGLWRSTCKVWFPRCKARARDAWHKAVCISETDLRRFTQDFTILLFQYCTILLCTILLLTIPLFAILPRPQPFASRKPTCAGSPRILLFYYHDPSRLAILLFYSTTTPAVCISQTHLYRLYHKVCISETELCMLTPKFAFDSTTTPAVCISKTHLYRLYHKVCIAETELCMLTPKFAC